MIIFDYFVQPLGYLKEAIGDFYLYKVKVRFCFK
jgi:hypothetical protein